MCAAPLEWCGVVWSGVDECSTTGVVWCSVEWMMCAAPLEWCGVVWSGVDECSTVVHEVELYVSRATICMWQCVLIHSFTTEQGNMSAQECSFEQSLLLFTVIVKSAKC